jgi:hypothetical protein
MSEVSINPFALLLHSMNSVLFVKPPPEIKSIVALADQYLSEWRDMFQKHHSPYPAISRPVNSVEREKTADSVSYLCDLILKLGTYSASADTFRGQLRSEIGRICDPVGFADGGPTEHAANVITESATLTLFSLRDSENLEILGIVTTATLFCFLRYDEWLLQQNGDFHSGYKTE